MNEESKNTGMTMSKTVLYGLILLGVLAILVIILVDQKKVSNQPSQPEAGVSTAENLSTDPSRMEVKGQMVEGFPAFPVYPGAMIEESSKVKDSPDSEKGYRAEWRIDKVLSVPQVMKWYLDELKTEGWTIKQAPVDPQTYGEQAAIVSKGDVDAHLNVEIGDDKKTTEIMVDIPIE